MNPVCQECNTPVNTVPTLVEYQGEEIFLFNPIICKSCLHRLCELYSTECANCGGCIPPYSQVGILKADNGEKQFIHMTTTCNTPGNAFYGYWSKGKPHDFIHIEACS